MDHRKGGTTYMDFPMMRYAEILLDYAEAENEAEDTNTAREKAIAQLNRIRRRAGITTDLLVPQIIIRQPFGNAYVKNAV
ncbi:RagB/SusD family nutrient uptake outer membrane protein [Bacteroides ovatus]|nr:RagB/SusD family nutrient uptake outer membrane protein [Bacteroides ovatus]